LGRTRVGERERERESWHVARERRARPAELFIRLRGGGGGVSRLAG